MKILKKITIGVIILFSIKANAQTDQKGILDTLAGRFVKNLRSDNHEKIFVHTNKWYYIAGENIWLKAYCMNALSHKIFRHSKIVFVDLVNDKDSIIERLLLNNQFQKLDGKISLSPFLQEGYYWLRSYTRSMLKRDINSISVQPIYILNAQKPLASIVADRSKIGNENSSDTARPDMTFSPEGGSVISGTNSTVAFRIVDKNQMPLTVSGYVTDPQDSVVTRFKTSMPGLGKFNFFIWKSRKYIAHIKSGNKEFEYPLPLINQFASQLSAIEQKDDYVRMQVSLGDSIYKKNKSSYVLGISRDSLCFSALGTDMYEFTVPKSNFPPGKATLLLFDEHQKIISERNIYIDKKNQEVNITTDKENYGAREKAKLEIAMNDLAKNTAEALLSVSVNDDNLVKGPGYFENIYQINNDNIELPAESNPLMSTYSPEQLDLIMLTQKNYDRNWQDKNAEKNLPDTSGDEDTSLNSINGKVTDEKNEPVKNDVITFFSNEGNSISETDTTNKSGRFHLPITTGLHAMQIILRVMDLKGTTRNDKIIIDTFQFPQFHTPEQLKKKFPEEEVGILKKFKAHQLDTMSIKFGKGWLAPVTIKEVKKKELSYDESKRVSRFSQIIAGSDLDLNRNSVEDALLMVHGISLKNGYVVINGGGSFTVGAKSEPLVLIDGTHAVRDSSSGSSPVINLFRSLSPESIDFIEVLTGSQGAAYGLEGGNGVILINTTTKQRNGVLSGMIKYSPRGFFISPPFDEPDYDKKNLKKSSEPDSRSAIFWDGDLFKGINGNVIVNFFTADSQTTYTVTVAGISTNGSIIFKQIKLHRE